MRTHVDFKGQTTLDFYQNTGSGERLVAEYRYAAAATIPAEYPEDPQAGESWYAEKTMYVYDDGNIPEAELFRLGRISEVQEYQRAAGQTSTVLVRATHYTYDAITGATASVTQLTGPDRTVESTINHEYDPATGRLTRTYTSHNDTVYGYDSQGRLEHVYAVVVSDTRYATFAG